MSILDDITRDLDWREAEIASMRVVLSSSGLTSIQKQTLLRAAWALLYAHYEGFCKNTLATYYDFISTSGVACGSLPEATRLFALKKKLTQMRNLQDNELVGEIINFHADCLSPTPDFPSVDTQSNLWPNLLVDLMKTADLNTEIVSENEIKLKTLVSRRNKIAHGENNIIQELEYYKSFEDAVYNVMYDLAIQVDRRLSQPPFVAQ